MVLIVTPCQASTRPAPTRDSGIAVMLIRAVRHSKRKAPSIRIIRRAPRIIAPPRLSMASSMKVAGRKMVGSTSIPSRPGRSSSIAASSPRVTSAVLAHGSFWTTRRSPGRSLMTPSPIRGGVSMTTSATSSSRSTLPSRTVIGTLARSRAVRIGMSCCTFSLCCGVSTNPPVPMNPPSENRSRPESMASAVTVMASSSVTSCLRRSSGSTWTVGILMRSPQIRTLATPGTRSSRARTFQ
jgi:hypothetical protein